MEQLELHTLVLRDRPENKATQAWPQIRAALGQLEPLEARQTCPGRRELPEPLEHLPPSRDPPEQQEQLVHLPQSLDPPEARENMDLTAVRGSLDLPVDMALRASPEEKETLAWQV